MKEQQTTGRHATVVAPGRKTAVGSLPWNPHPKFTGVFLRNLVTGQDTGGHVSLHHVRIDPHCAIGDHTHAGMVEIHEVIAGRGSCTRAGTKIPYNPGVVGVMPADEIHRVDTGDEGLLLLATFSPPLV